jgi:ribosomal protein L40E
MGTGMSQLRQRRREKRVCVPCGARSGGAYRCKRCKAKLVAYRKRVQAAQPVREQRQRSFNWPWSPTSISSWTELKMKARWEASHRRPRPEPTPEWIEQDRRDEMAELSEIALMRRVA